MTEYSTPDGQHKGDYTHNSDVSQTVQSLPSNKILNTYTTRRDYMADLRKQKSPWHHWPKTFGNYLGNFKANLTKMATKMQKSFDEKNRVSRSNDQPQAVFMPHSEPKRSEQATKTTTPINEGLDNGNTKQLRENLNVAPNNVKNFFNSISKGTRHFGNSVMDALELRDLQKPMQETMVKGHQAAKKVRNYLKKPDKEKQREQNKEQEPEFLQGFSNFIHHPREAVHKAAHQAKYGFTSLMLVLTAKRLARMKQKQAQLEKRQAQFKRITRERGVPNKQGMSLERDSNLHETLQTPKNGVNLKVRANTSTPAKSDDVALTVPHANVPRLNKRGPVVETHVAADPVANYEELAQQDAQRDYLEQHAQEAETEEPQMEPPEPHDEDVPPEPEQSNDERNDRKIEAHKMRQQAKKHTTPVNNTLNEPNANMDSLEDNIPPEPETDNIPLPSENDLPPEPMPPETNNSPLPSENDLPPEPEPEEPDF